MDKEQSFNFVRTILQSPIFHNQSLEQRVGTLDQILATGQITREELSRLINEAQQQTIQEQTNREALPQTNAELMNAAMTLESLPYDAFVSVVRQGGIKGKNLISLCLTSRKLNGYCNKDLVTKDGRVLSKYLFRRLLSDQGIEVPEGQDPREFYKYFTTVNLPTASLLQLAALIVRNSAYFPERRIVKWVGFLLEPHFPGLKLPPKLSVNVLRDLGKYGWISNGKGLNPYSPISPEGMELEKYRRQIYDFVIQNISWLFDQSLWPPINDIMGPGSGAALDPIFMGSGISLILDSEGGRIRRPNTFQERIKAIAFLLQAAANHLGQAKN